MKIDQVLVQYLYNHKLLTLQGIGTFHLDSNAILPPDTEKDLSLPPNAITFNFNPKVTEDDLLIDAIVANTKKIKPLASADLDSFLMLGRQFLNIGKPFNLEGIGTLHRAHHGDLEFVPGQFINPRIDVPKNLSEGEHIEENVNFHEYGSQQTGNNKVPILITVALVLMAAIGFAIWYFNYREPETTAVTNDTSVMPVDTLTNLPATDTARPLVTGPDTSTVAALGGNDYTFRVVFKITTDQKSAQSSLTKLNSWGHKVVMYTEDSVNYKLAELFNRPLADTTIVRDSLQRFYRSSVVVETR